ncbi:hypothetical protein ACC806_38440, partial [Rhizobium ruizarguesonis]
MAGVQKDAEPFDENLVARYVVRLVPAAFCNTVSAVAKAWGGNESREYALAAPGDLLANAWFTP